jgi:benzil reductase ((S)-benzoin forming)
MRYYYVTGSSRGIGRCLALELLSYEDATVIGISRGQSIEHPRYRHHTLDFTDLNAVSAFAFELHADAAQVALINNAGFIQPRLMGRFDPRLLIETYLINAVAPGLLTNAFLAAYPASADRLICNVSSGATSRAGLGAGPYAAAKAALETMSRNLLNEAEFRKDMGLRVMVVSPGAVDTDMQEVLRDQDDDEFPNAVHFRQMKADGTLASPEAVAAKLCHVLRDPSLAPGLMFSISDIPES